MGDYRPAFTLWERRVGGQDVFIVQGEGGEPTEADVDSGFDQLRMRIPSSDRYSTFYDLTMGMKRLLRFTPNLVSFVSDMRRLCGERQVSIAVVCPDDSARNWTGKLLGLVGNRVPTYIGGTTEETWSAMLAGGKVDDRNSALGSSDFSS